METKIQLHRKIIMLRCVKFSLITILFGIICYTLFALHEKTLNFPITVIIMFSIIALFTLVEGVSIGIRRAGKQLRKIVRAEQPLNNDI